jgi:death on curing protein
VSWQNNIVWLTEKIILAIHDDQLVVNGGSPGIRDENLLLACLDRPKNLLTYGEPEPNIFDLAAAYAFGFTMNHAFIDGNKRVVFVAAAIFLELNEYSFNASEQEVVLKFEGLAEKRETQESIATWLKSNSVKHE